MSERDDFAEDLRGPRLYDCQFVNRTEHVGLRGILELRARA